MHTDQTQFKTYITLHAIAMKLMKKSPLFGIFYTQPLFQELGCIHIDTSTSPSIRVRVTVNMNLHVFQWSRSH